VNAVLDLEYRQSVLGSIPPLRDSVRELMSVAGAKIRCSVYQRGERVYGETDETNHVYALHRGRVRTLRVTPQGKDVTLYLVEPGQLFGVDAIAHGEPGGRQWGHDAEAIDHETVVIAMPQQEFSDVAGRHPSLMNHIVRSLWSQSQDLMDQAETRAFHDVRGRVAHALLLLAYKEGKASARGLVINPAMTHEELAALAGTRRESVTMALGAWKREGVLAIDEGERSIVLLDVMRLAEYREGGTSAQLAVEAILARLSQVEKLDQRENRVARVELARERWRAAYREYTRS